MNSRLLSTVAVLAALVPTGAVGQQVLSRDAVGATDVVDWADVLGPVPGAGYEIFAADPFTVALSGGLTMTTSTLGGTNFGNVAQSIWPGSFPNNDRLLWTDDGPLFFEFNQGIRAFGLNVQAYNPSFFATILAFDADLNQILSWGRPGTGAQNGGSAVWLGVEAGVSDIYAVGIQVRAPDGSALRPTPEFVVDRVSIRAEPVAVPEPGTLILLATGLLGLGAMRIRRRGYGLLTA